MDDVRIKISYYERVQIAVERPDLGQDVGYEIIPKYLVFINEELHVAANVYGAYRMMAFKVKDIIEWRVISTDTSKRGFPD